mgnify:CR=1 FL=1
MLRLIDPALVLIAVACGGETPVRGGGAPAHPGAPVIVISIDTLRADHLPAYGYEGLKTPAIDALRKDGILYTKAWSHCPMTLPSHVSILTGLLPYEHGVPQFARLDRASVDKVLPGYETDWDAKREQALPWGCRVTLVLVSAPDVDSEGNFVEDVAASGGYMIAVAGDEILSSGDGGATWKPHYISR